MNMIVALTIRSCKKTKRYVYTKFQLKQNQPKRHGGKGRMVIPGQWSDLESHVRTVLPAPWPLSQDQHSGGVPTSYPGLPTPNGIGREEVEERGRKREKKRGKGERGSEAGREQQGKKKRERERGVFWVRVLCGV